MKKLFHIKGEARADETADKALALSIGEKHFSFAITGNSGNTLHELAWHSIDRLQGDSLDSLFELYPSFSNHPFKKVNIVTETARSVLTPAALFREESAAIMLKTFHPVNGAAVVMNEEVKGMQVYNTYAVDKHEQELLSRRFGTFFLQHNYSLVIGNVTADSEKGQVELIFNTDEFSLLAFAGGRLLLAQQFPYSSPDDVLYYLLKTIQQFGLSQQETELSLSGLVDRESALFRELYQYFLKIRFREANWQTPAHEYPAHYFTTLNDLARCGS